MNTAKREGQLTCDILLVDNKKVSRDMVQRLLAHGGYRVITAEHGQEAIDILSEKGFGCSLVITETIMPYVNGFDLIRYVKSGPGFPVMVLSGTGDERTVSEVFRLRADDFMKKPFLDTELLLRVGQLLAHTSAPAMTMPRMRDISAAIRGVAGSVLRNDSLAVRLAS